MKVLVCGGRNYTDKRRFDSFMDDFSQRKQRVICIIEGGATDADRLARNWAEERMLPVMTFKANWGKFGKAAGPIRNEWMLDYGTPEYVIAFPGGKGTENMVDQADQACVSVIKVDW